MNAEQLLGLMDMEELLELVHSADLMDQVDAEFMSQIGLPEEDLSLISMREQEQGK